MTESKIYFDRGVSSAKTEIHQAISTLDRGLFPGAFCKVLPDTLTHDPAYCLLMHADGAGTKSSLAYLYWKETGEIDVFKGIATDSLVMNLDDLACVGAVDHFLLSNTIGRNKFLIPGEIIKTVIDGFNETIVLLAKYGIRIDLCGGETADVGDVVKTILVDSTITTRLKRTEVIDLDMVQAGDCIVGLASFGQALWENEYNSGIGSNGLTAARHDSLDHSYAERYPETFSTEIPPSLVYCGKGKVTDPLPGTPVTIGRALLSPTRTYTPLIKKLLQALPGQIHGMIHCTGGGQTKCLKFGKGIHYIKDDLFPVPPIFTYLMESGKIDLQAMYPVFNMGHRLEIFVDHHLIGQVMACADECGIAARVVGRCEASSDQRNHLTIRHQNQTFTY